MWESVGGTLKRRSMFTTIKPSLIILQWYFDKKCPAATDFCLI